jgi:hypothetical protein
MRLTEGQRIATPLGAGRIVRLHNAKDEVMGHGKAVRGLAYAVVELDRGGRRVYPARELRPEGAE